MLTSTALLSDAVQGPLTQIVSLGHRYLYCFDVIPGHRAGGFNAKCLNMIAHN